MPSRNDIRFISTDSICSILGKKFCKTLPLKKLEKDAQGQNVFGHLGQLDDDHSNGFPEIEKFTCKMYGKKNLKKNDVRVETFTEKYKPETDRDKISCA